MVGVFEIPGEYLMCGQLCRMQGAFLFLISYCCNVWILVVCMEQCGMIFFSLPVKTLKKSGGRKSHSRL